MGSAESSPVADPETLGTDGMLPDPGVLSHQILFDQHRFDFDQNDDKLLSMDCAVGRQADPLNPQLTDDYVAVGLRTKFDGPGVAKYGRPPVNLVLVIDCSGSMKAHFRSARSGDLRSKYDVAKKVLLAEGGLLDRLKPDDKLAILTFNTETKVLQDLMPVSKLLKDRVEAMLEKQKPVGTTNLSQAVDTAVGIMKNGLGDRERRHPLLAGNRLPDLPPPSLVTTDTTTITTDDGQPRRLRRADTMYCQHLVDLPENRLMILTDEYLTPEDPDHEMSLNTLLRHADESQIHTTFIAMGVNYPPFISTRLSLVVGCNVISVHSAEQLRDKIVTEFDHICSPIAYNVTVAIESPLPEIVETFGMAFGKEVLKVKSVFAGAGDGGSVHCSVGVLRLAGPIQSERLRCTTSYIDRVGAHHSETVEFSISDRSECPAFRKAVALSRLGTVLKVFLNDEAGGGVEGSPGLDCEKGIVPLPVELKPRWEGGEGEVGVVFSASEGEEEEEVEAEASSDPLLEKWVATPVKKTGSVKSSGSRRLSHSANSQSAHQLVPQSRVSSHYKKLLEKYARHLQGEAESLHDPTLLHWYNFLDAIVHYIPEEDITTAAESQLTARVIYTGIEPDQIFDVLNEDRYRGRLRENHRIAVNKVYNKKMQGAILEVVAGVVEGKPEWVVASEDVKEEVRGVVRKSFLHLERDEEWGLWRERWDPLVDATLRSVLHGKIFMVAKRIYPSMKGDTLSTHQMTERVLLELTALSPALPSVDTTTKSRHLPDLQSFVSRWIVPSLEKYDGNCKWCPEQGVPISTCADDVPEVGAAQCPTQ